MDSCCSQNRESMTNGCAELEPVLVVDEVLPGRPEGKPRCVEVDGKSCQRTRHRSHGHFGSTHSPNMESLDQLNGGYTRHIDSDGPTSHGVEDQFRLDLDVDGFLAAGTDAAKFQFSAGVKDSYNQCTGRQGPDTSERWNAAGRYCQKIDFNNFVEKTGSPDQKGATKAQDECSWNFEGACKGARCWERKNGCTLLQSYTATGGGHHSKYFHQHLRGKARKKSVRGHHRNIRRATPAHLASVWPLTKHNALLKRSCMKYARGLQLTARPSRVLSAAAAPAMTLSKPSAPAVSAFLNSIRHSGRCRSDL